MGQACGLKELFEPLFKHTAIDAEGPVHVVRLAETIETIIGALSKKHQSTLKTSFHVLGCLVLESICGKPELGRHADTCKFRGRGGRASSVKAGGLRARTSSNSSLTRFGGISVLKMFCRTLEVTSEQECVPSSAGCGGDVRKRLQ